MIDICSQRIFVTEIWGKNIVTMEENKIGYESKLSKNYFEKTYSFNFSTSI